MDTHTQDRSQEHRARALEARALAQNACDTRERADWLVVARAADAAAEDPALAAMADDLAARASRTWSS